MFCSRCADWGAFTFDFLSQTSRHRPVSDSSHHVDLWTTCSPLPQTSAPSSTQPSQFYKVRWWEFGSRFSSCWHLNEGLSISSIGAGKLLLVLRPPVGSNVVFKNQMETLGSIFILMTITWIYALDILWNILMVQWMSFHAAVEA